MMMGELFASDVKGVASAIAVMFNWTLVFIITKTFGMMQKSWGSGELYKLTSLTSTSLQFLSFSRANFLLLRSLHGSWNDFRVHQSSRDERQIKCSNSSDPCRQELRNKQFLEQFRTVIETQHSQHHHHFETKFLSQDFFNLLFFFLFYKLCKS